jgi:hypothetical protein
MNSTTTPAYPIPSHFDFRMQKRVIAGNQYIKSCEIWDKEAPGVPLVFSNVQTLSGSAAVAGTNVLTVAGNSANKVNFDVELRIYTTGLVPVGSPPPSKVGRTADYFDFPFEGTTPTELGDDVSAGNRNLTWINGITSVDTPLLGPACTLEPEKTFRAGDPMLVDGSGTWSRNDISSPITYNWNILEMPPDGVGVTKVVGNIWFLS